MAAAVRKVSGYGNNGLRAVPTAWLWLKPGTQQSPVLLAL